MKPSTWLQKGLVCSVVLSLGFAPGAYAYRKPPANQPPGERTIPEPFPGVDNALIEWIKTPNKNEYSTFDSEKLCKGKIQNIEAQGIASCEDLVSSYASLILDDELHSTVVSPQSKDYLKKYRAFYTKFEEFKAKKLLVTNNAEVLLEADKMKHHRVSSTFDMKEFKEIHTKAVRFKLSHVTSGTRESQAEIMHNFYSQESYECALKNNLESFRNCHYVEFKNSWNDIDTLKAKLNKQEAGLYKNVFVTVRPHKLIDHRLTTILRK